MMTIKCQEEGCEEIAVHHYCSDCVPRQTPTTFYGLIETVVYWIGSLSILFGILTMLLIANDKTESLLQVIQAIRG